MTRMRAPSPGRYTLEWRERRVDVTITRGSGMKGVLTPACRPPEPGGYVISEGVVLLVVDGGTGAVLTDGGVRVVGSASRMTWPRRTQVTASTLGVEA